MILQPHIFNRNIKIFALNIIACLWLQTHTAETNAFAIIPLPTLALHNVPESITDTAKNEFPLGRRFSTSRIKYYASTSNQHTNRRHGRPQSQSHSFLLFAHAGNDNRNTCNKCNTAIEAAVVVEWEPVTLSELERRIDEGINYQCTNREKDRDCDGDGDTHFKRDLVEEDRHQGIFCGYKVTEEEAKRLKSADPDDYDYSPP